MEDKAAERDWENFIYQLKGAICLEGGFGDDRWEDMTLKKVYTGLHPTGVRLCFTVEPYNKQGNRKIYE